LTLFKLHRAFVAFFEGLVAFAEFVQSIYEQVQPRLLAMFVFSQAGNSSPVAGHTQL